MRRVVAGYVYAAFLFLLAQSTAFADGTSSMELSLTVVVPDPEPGFMMDGIQAIMLLAGVGLALILTSTVLKSLYSRLRG